MNFHCDISLVILARIRTCDVNFIVILSITALMRSLIFNVAIFHMLHFIDSMHNSMITKFVKLPIIIKGITLNFENCIRYFHFNENI